MMTWGWHGTIHGSITNAALNERNDVNSITRDGMWSTLLGDYPVGEAFLTWGASATVALLFGTLLLSGMRDSRRKMIHDQEEIRAGIRKAPKGWKRRLQTVGYFTNPKLLVAVGAILSQFAIEIPGFVANKAITLDARHVAYDIGERIQHALDMSNANGPV